MVYNVNVCYQSELSNEQAAVSARTQTRRGFSHQLLLLMTFIHGASFLVVGVSVNTDPFSQQKKTV